MNWYAALFYVHNGVWSGGDVLHEIARGDRAIPAAVLTHLAEAGRIRVLVPNEIRMVSLLLPDDLHKEEIQSAIANGLFDEFEDAASSARFTAARADLYGMSLDESSLLVSRFELRQIARFEKDLAESELRLDAVGALESAMLDWHARNHSTERLLFVGRQTSLYAVPESDAAPFVISSFPIGMDAPTNETSDRMDRVIKRIVGQRNRALRVVLMEGVSEEQRSWLTENLVDVAAWYDFRDIQESVLLRMAESSVGVTDAPLALVDAPPVPKDPHRSGTVVFFAVILISCFMLGNQLHSLRVELKTGQARQADWRMLKSARTAAQTQLKRSTEKRARLQSKLTQLSPGQRWMPEGLMPILETLGRESTTYSRITSIAQQSDGAFDIHGITLWQTEVSRINAALQQTAERENMIHEMKEVSGSDARVQCFEFVMQAHGGRL